jgi:hypothetical protein
MRAVICTRFSTAQQREASSEDQARNCRRKIEACDPKSRKTPAISWATGVAGAQVEANSLI